MKAFLGWLEERTGAGKLAHELLCANIPGGARWRYVWGGTLLFAIGLQFITGVFLWLDYSPSAQTAWESVNYIQNEMSGGWLVRGLHHYNAQLLPVLLVLHLMQVVIGGAYKSPREVNFWVGLVLLQLVLMTALTGYQLPWDQKGFWATKVAMNLMGVVPTFGPALQRMLIGGAEYGHLTLTRFFAVHAGDFARGDHADAGGAFLLVPAAWGCRGRIENKTGCPVLARPGIAERGGVSGSGGHADVPDCAAPAFFHAGIVGGGTGRAGRSIAAVLGRAAGMVFPVHVSVSEAVPRRT